jgi:hypothetical protein
MSDQDTNAPWRNEEILRQKYWDESKSSIQIADELGCGKTTVLNWMKKHNIERRKENKDKFLSPYTIKRGYEAVDSTIDENSNPVHLHRLLAVAKYGFEAVKGMDVHHKNRIPWDNRSENIELLSRSEHPSAHAKNKEAPWRDKELLQSELEENNQTELGEKWDCNQSLISRWCKRHGLRE